jgi:hypothetical protein
LSEADEEWHEEEESAVPEEREKAARETVLFNMKVKMNSRFSEIVTHRVEPT